MTDEHPATDGHEGDRSLAALLLLIVACSALLRFWNLANQAWIDVEDIQQVGYARDLVEKGFLGNGAAYIMWTMLGAGARLLGGKGPYGEMLLSAALGTSSVVLMYVLGTRWHSRAAGVIAAALLGASLNHIHFSRWAQPQAAALFFVLLGFVLYDAALRRGRSVPLLFLAGATAGLGLLCHFSFIVLAAAVVFLEACSDGVRPSAVTSASKNVASALWRKAVTRAVVMAAALSTPLILAETVVRVLRHLTGDPRIGSPIGHLWLTPHYVGFSGGVVQSIQTPQPLFFWRHLWNVEGLLLVVTAVAGWIGLTVWVAWRRGRAMSSWLPWAFITCAYVASFLYTLSTGLRIYRYIGPLVPGAIVAAALFLGWGARHLRQRAGRMWATAAVAACCVAWMAGGFLQARARISFDTGFEDVWTELEASRASRVAFLGSPGSESYGETSKWRALTDCCFPHDTVTLKQFEEVPRVDPPPDTIVVGMDYDGVPPNVPGFRVTRAIRIRIPGYDALPTEKWITNQVAFILRRQ